MSTTPRARGRSSHHRARCKCFGVGGNKGDRATPCCSFNALRSLFRCPGRDRSRSRSKHRQRTPSRVREAPVAAGAQEQQQTQEEEPSFFVYAMPNQQGGGGGGKHKKTKRGKPRMPSFGSCFRRNKKKRKQQAKAAAAVGGPCPALTPAPSLLTHPPGSPAPEKAQAVTPSVTQPPSPAPTENGSTVNSPAPRGWQPDTPNPAKQSTDSAQSPFALQTQQQQPKQVEGPEIVEVATGERLSTHELGLIEMVGSSIDNSAESSVKSSLEYVSEPPPPPPPQRTVERSMVEREAAVLKVKEAPKLWLNGTSAESRARERFAEPLVTTAAEELWAHDVACSRVHAVMLAETVSCSSS
ncbi:hypothetical protein BS78_01G380300 [Paspalum vaginatum]|nr:hypothetical protein BS78_01G380300 [Paspalum vaginatum]